MSNERHITSQADTQTREIRRHCLNSKNQHPDWRDVFRGRNHRTDQLAPVLHNHQPSAFWPLLVNRSGGDWCCASSLNANWAKKKAYWATAPVGAKRKPKR